MAEKILDCPVCGRPPDIDKCGPETCETGPLGWYANCYSEQPYEHNVSVNGETHEEVKTLWNAEVRRVATDPVTHFGDQSHDRWLRATRPNRG